MRLTPQQAKELAHRGYIVTLVKMLGGEYDEYLVTVKEN